jgi:hypothetical protein
VTRVLQEIAVWVKHEGKISFLEANPESWSCWIPDSAATEAPCDGVAILIGGNYGRSSKTINRHTFRGIGEVRENGGGSWGGNEKATAWQTNHP